VPCSFDGANFRQDKEKGAENTLCIVKPFDAELAEIGPSKPCSNWRHQATLPQAGQISFAEVSIMENKKSLRIRSRLH
jgi:hypothetical protein